MPRGTFMMASAAARLLRAYTAQAEVLRRLKNGGSQVVRVEHVHVNEGGQAVIGNVRSSTRDPPTEAQSPNRLILPALR
jgi:hypothetical protein